MASFFVATLLKFFFLITPFFALSMFLAMTSELSDNERRALAGRVCVAAWMIAMLMFLCGQIIFKLFGISVDAFRIGAGALLFLSAVALMAPAVVVCLSDYGRRRAFRIWLAVFAVTMLVVLCVAYRLQMSALNGPNPLA